MGNETDVRDPVGDDPSVEDESGCTPLCRAIRDGDVATIEALLAGAWRTPLHVVSFHDNVAAIAIEALLAAGGDANAKDRWGSTALHLAIRHDHAALVEALIVGGADVQARDGCDMTPLDVVKYWKSSAALQVLERHKEEAETCKWPFSWWTSHDEKNADGDRPSASEEGSEAPSRDAKERNVAAWLSSTSRSSTKGTRFTTYRAVLIERGFEAMEALELLREEHLEFMKPGHRMLLAKGLAENSVVSELAWGAWGACRGILDRIIELRFGKNRVCFDKYRDETT